MADDDHADFCGFRETHQLRRAFTQLRDRTGGRAHRRELHGLNRIDDQQPDLFIAGPRHCGVEVGIGDHAQLRAGNAEATRAHPDLRRGLFRGQVQGWGGARGVVGQLQQQRRLAYAGLTA